MICRNSFASLVFVVRNRLLIFISSSSLWKRAFPYLTAQKKHNNKRKEKSTKTDKHTTQAHKTALTTFLLFNTLFPCLFSLFSSSSSPPIFCSRSNIIFFRWKFFYLFRSHSPRFTPTLVFNERRRALIFFFASSFSACIIFSWTRASGSFPIPLGCCFAVVRLERESCGSVKMKMKPQPKRKHQQNARQKKQQQRVRDKHFHTAPKEKKTFLFKQFVFLISKSRDAGVRFRKPYWQRSEKMQKEKWNKKEDARGSTKKRINM